MSTALSLFTPQSLPAHVAAFLDEEANIPERNTIPSLTFKGKVWTITVNGDSKPLMKRDEEGDQVPVQVIPVVILDFQKRRGRMFFEGNYDPNKPGKPKCWSDDGVTPHPNVREKQAVSCAACPLAAKGSRISDDGKQTTACSQHRLLVVIPEKSLEFPALRLKLAITSDYDGQSPELEAAGWYAFSNYMDLLRSKNVKHTGALVTKIKFDPNAAYPKLIFSPSRWLDANELAKVAERAKSDEVKALLSSDALAADVAAQSDEMAPVAAAPVAAAPVAPPTPAPAKASQPAPAAPVATAVVDEDEDLDALIASAVPVAAPPAPPAPPAPTKGKGTRKAAPAAPAAPVAAPADDDDGDAFGAVLTAPVATPAAPAAPAKTSTPAPAATAVAVSADVPDEIAALMEEWGDE